MTGSHQWYHAGQTESWRHTVTEKGRRKEHERQRWAPFSSFERSDIWNKEASYVSSSFWDRQTDRGQILPARQINRPRRVGSLRDDSFIHTQGNGSTHRHKLYPLHTQKFLKNTSPVQQKCTMHDHDHSAWKP